MQVSSAADVLRVIKEQLADQLSRPKYELLIRPLTAIDYSPAAGSGNSSLRLGISNEVLRGWLVDQYGDLLSELAGLICGAGVDVPSRSTPRRRRCWTSWRRWRRTPRRAGCCARPWRRRGGRS
jgi:hypothetical protein